LARWNADFPAGFAWKQVMNADRFGWRVVYVARVYQNARHGEKLLIADRLPGHGDEDDARLVRNRLGALRLQDTWMRGRWPVVGSWMAVTGGSGFGPHTNNPNTFYVGQVLNIAPPGARQAWHRCEAALWTPPTPPGGPTPPRMVGYPTAATVMPSVPTAGRPH
jgi:hypothetical protein